MSDRKVEIQQLKDMVREFCEARDWDQFHGAKDLAIGLSTEAAELLEHFRFQSEAQVQAIMNEPQRRKEIGHELADCLFFILRMAQKYDFDLSDVLADKMELNGRKYPVETFRGRNNKA